MPAPEPLADDIGGISAWQPSTIWPWLCVAGKRRRIWQVSLSFLQSSAPATAQNPQPISAAPYTAERAVTRFSPSSHIACSLLCASHPSVSPLHIHLMSFHQRCTLLLFPSSHPQPLYASPHTLQVGLMPVIGCFCIMDGFSLAGDHFGIPHSPISFTFSHPFLFSGPSSIRFPPWVSIGSCHYGAVRQKRERARGDTLL